MPRGLFDNEAINIPCPKCGNQSRKTVGWLKRNSNFPCSRCGETIEVNPEQFRREISNAEKELKDFQKEIKKHSKNIQIKF